MKIKHWHCDLSYHVDDILLIGNALQGIIEIRLYLHSQFSLRDLGKPKYFLSIEVSYRVNIVSLSQPKYALDLFKETVMLALKSTYTPMTLNE